MSWCRFHRRYVAVAVKLEGRYCSVSFTKEFMVEAVRLFKTGASLLPRSRET